MARSIILSIVCLATFMVVQGDDNNGGGMFSSMDPFSCKQLGQKCKGFPRCCGELVCLWTGNFNPLELAFRLEDEDYWQSMLGGVCVQCVGDGLKCQRDAHCCGELQCDKSSRLTINGKCRPKREDGRRCHTDDMCIGECDKSWYEMNGVCIGGGTGPLPEGPITPAIQPPAPVPTQPTQPIQPIQPIQPVQPIQPIQPTQPTAEDIALNEALEGLLEP